MGPECPDAVGGMREWQLFEGRREQVSTAGWPSGGAASSVDAAHL